MNATFLLRTVLLALFVLVLSQAAHAKGFRILHVMSYHAAWEWNREQFDGFKEALSGLDIEYRVVELDAKRVGKEQLEAKAQGAVELIKHWKPHLVYVNDDIAQEYVTRKFVNSKIPFVYSGVNKAPKDYGFDKASNITGVLEQEHFLATVKLLRQFQPEVRKIAVITDRDPTWQGVLQRMRQQLEGASGLSVVEWIQPKTFDEYKARVAELQNKVDALAVLGIFNFSDGGSFADYEDVLRWTAENSRLPDFSFWSTRVERGTLCAVIVSGVEQGREAGRIARRILVDKTAPQHIEAKPTTKGRPMVSLARARELGIAVPSSVLLSSEVITRHAWSK